MAYQLSRKAKSSYLAPEETIVLRALAEYCFEPMLTTAADFMPTQVLFERYRSYVQGRPDCPPHLLLNAQGFGAALRRVHDIDPARKVQKRYKGRAVWGYAFVQGPGSIKVNARAGRRCNAAI